jgi:hypothetical protein
MIQKFYKAKYYKMLIANFKILFKIIIKIIITCLNIKI